MTTADLIYNALLRAERSAERDATPFNGYVDVGALAVLRAVALIREEIGNGIAEEEGRS